MKDIKTHKDMTFKYKSDRGNCIKFHPSTWVSKFDIDKMKEKGYILHSIGIEKDTKKLLAMFWKPGTLEV